MERWPAIDGLCYGGDYNPEQWPEKVWHDDVRLMREAGVNMVTVGVFSWASLEPEEGRYEFGWLDRVLELLHDGGLRIDLATATASPPPWFSHKYPESLPVTQDGRRQWWGSRQTFCPSSAVYRKRAAALVQSLAERYGDHPALVLWHVHNEYACHNASCYCDVSAVAFRRWAERRYGSIDRLNDAWGTSFWSQRYTSFDQIIPPRLSGSFVNPMQQLDFRRFCSDELLDCMRAEIGVLRETTPDVPITTNFMAAGARNLDYWAWARELDVVSNDHYLRMAEPESHIDLSFAADVSRSLAGGAPWLLMEHSTSAVNWQPRNRPKAPGQMVRNSLTHVGRGADAVCFFQWRASKQGAEKFHSGMVPHAGTDTKIWREVRDLGAKLRALEEVRGTTVDSDVALLFDYHAWWACELNSHPSVDVKYADVAREIHAALWEQGVTTDVAHPEADLSRYRLVVVPTLYLVTDAGAENIRSYVESGGTVLITYFSGIVDEKDAIRMGGYPGAFRDLIGGWTEEFWPLLRDEKVRLSDGTRGSVWTEWLHATTAEVVATYVEGPLAGIPALTRNRFGQGTAWYLGTKLGRRGFSRLLERITEEAGVEAAASTRPGVEVVRRRGERGTYLFVLNHLEGVANVPAQGYELLSETEIESEVTVPGGGVAVVRLD